MGIFYEVKLGRIVSKGYARRAQPGLDAPGGGFAIRCRFITVKLHAGVWYPVAGSYHIGSCFIHKEQNRCDKGWQSPGQLGRALQRHGTRAWRIEHEADGVGAGGHRGVDILLAGQAADLDAGAGGK